MDILAEYITLEMHISFFDKIQSSIKTMSGDNNDDRPRRVRFSTYHHDP